MSQESRPRDWIGQVHLFRGKETDSCWYRHTKLGDKVEIRWFASGGWSVSHRGTTTVVLSRESALGLAQELATSDRGWATTVEGEQQ